ncbi:MAG TPA: Ig-like domain-containing protein [Gammaproteobacteria bacterium]|nr:Ig-like domain-containing protein [Gammaproteobacteria bacterium]
MIGSLGRTDPFTLSLLIALAVTAATTAGAAGPAPGAATGSEFRINTTTSGDQFFGRTARDAAGDFVVVWAGPGDGSGNAVYAQRYMADGTPVGGETQVNTHTTGDQTAPSVAMDAGGDYVVVWASNGQDGDGFGIYGQRFGSSGATAGSEFLVNTYTTGNQSSPSVGMDAGGGFVVAWDSAAQDGDLSGVYAQMYDSTGAAEGSEFRVNTTTTDNQNSSQVAMDANGGFVIVYESNLLDGHGDGIFAKLYDNTGADTGLGEFQVNTTTADEQYSPSVAMDMKGNFTVSWVSFNQDAASGGGIYAQRYNTAGAAQGGEFLVNTTTAGDQDTPSIAMDALGNFAIAWMSPSQDGAGKGVYAQRYAASGSTRGSEFQVNTTTTSDQFAPRMAMDAAGDFVIAWTSNLQDGGGFGVYAQRYARESSLDLSVFSFSVDPPGTVAKSDPLALTASIINTAAPSSATGNATIISALTTATGVTASLDLPAGTAFVDASGTNWTCPGAPTGNVLVCAYAVGLTPGATTENLTVDVKAPTTKGLKTFTLNADGNQPDDTASDDSASQAVTIPDTPPFAFDDVQTVNSGAQLSGNVSAMDIDNDSLTFSVANTASSGNLTLNPDGSYTYTSTPGFKGADSFSFVANDGEAFSNPGTVDITVADNAPTTVNASLPVNRNTAKKATLKSTDVDGDPRTYAKVAGPTHGTVTLAVGGGYTYKPAKNYVGKDSFTFKANDGSLDSNTSSVAVTVTEHTPVATAASFSMTHNTSHNGQLKGTDADTGDILTYAKVAAPKHGTLTLHSTGSFTYTPVHNYVGSDSFTFHVSDGLKTSTAKTISITVK